MPNQYGPFKPIFQKCENPACTNQVRRTERQVAIGRYRYCSNSCAKRAQPRKYGPEVGEWIIERLGTMKYKEMAEYWGIEAGVFTHLLGRLRQKGYAIPYSKGKNVNIKKAVKVKIINPPLKKPHMPKKVKAPDALPVERKGKTAVSTKGPAQRKHMDSKPPVDFAHIKKPVKVFKKRKIVDGPIVIVLNDKNHTRLTARDEEHADRIRKKYAYLEKDLVARF